MSHDHVEVKLPPGIETQVDETLPWRMIVGASLAALALFAVSTVFALFVLKDVQGDLTQHNQHITRELGQPEIGMVEQRQIELETRAQEAKKNQTHQLDNYGWIDREKKLIHVPIEQGMQMVVEGKR